MRVFLDAKWLLKTYLGLSNKKIRELVPKKATKKKKNYVYSRTEITITRKKPKTPRGYW
jgi:hypothetical protein